MLGAESFHKWGRGIGHVWTRMGGRRGFIREGLSIQGAGIRGRKQGKWLGGCDGESPVSSWLESQLLDETLIEVLLGRYSAEVVSLCHRAL